MTQVSPTKATPSHADERAGGVNLSLVGTENSRSDLRMKLSYYWLFVAFVS